MAQVIVLSAFWTPLQLEQLFSQTAGGGVGTRYADATPTGFVAVTPLAVALTDGTSEISASVFGTGLIYNAAGIPSGGTIDRVEIFDGQGRTALLIEDLGFRINEPLSVGAIESGVLAGDDFVVATGENDVISTFDGDDLVIAGDGIDSIDGGDGNDTLFGGLGSDRLDGGGSRDTGNDILHGEDGGDLLYGRGGDDQLYGGTGDDLLDGGAGNDFLEGGEGNDGFRVPVRAGDNVVVGGEGNDRLELTVAVPGPTQGTTTFVGGAGVDEVNLTALGAIADEQTLQVFLDGGWIGFDSGETIAYVSEVERVVGSVTSENLLVGNDGTNELLGGKRDDYINGGAGRDFIVGGEGDDVLEGGDGDDIFILPAAFASSDLGDDLILDFEIGTDVIDFSLGAAVGGFGDLQLNNDGFGTLITYAASSLYVANLDGADLTADDFIF